MLSSLSSLLLKRRSLTSVFVCRYSTTMEQYIPRAKQLLNFIDKSVSPYHASARSLLDKVGFELLSENTQWELKPGGKYYFTRNQSTIVAFAIGHKFKPGNGFNIVGAHTDSPNLKIKPHSAVESGGFSQVGVELYGGGLWHTWFDRDLTVAGRVLVKVGDKFESRLVKIDKPLLRIPTLAIHLDRSVSTDGFKFNTQTHLLPIISSVVKKELGSDKPDHHPLLLDFVAKQLGVAVSDIQTFDLNLCDTLPGAIGGGLDEYVFTPRLDNLGMSYCSIQALTEAVTSPAFEQETNVHTVFLFDNEEVGSNTAQGAASPVVLDVVNRVNSIEPSNNITHVVDQSIRRSFLISADMAHALHPNYTSHHEPLHQPKINGGPIIKHNANQRYATTAYSAFIIKELGKLAGVPIQEFVVKNDSACGSTIGPIVATLSGIRTVDIGNPQLSMHSIREQAGVADVTFAINLFKAFFEKFSDLDSRIKIDA